MKIGKYITLEEATKSQLAVYRGLKNEPAGAEISAMAKLCAHIYDPLCDHFGIKLPFSSFYRSAALNAALKGSSSTSQHCQGEAMDIDLDGSGLAITNSVVFQYIMNNLPFDQLFGSSVIRRTPLGFMYLTRQEVCSVEWFCCQQKIKPEKQNTQNTMAKFSPKNYWYLS